MTLIIRQTDLFVKEKNNKLQFDATYSQFILN